ncbi:MAG: [acyl-carrier-protein] S-malonyltransferase [Flavobacteriales bacterium]|nr:[acyl-carrier-protein] S-malonyltransferase [Flavobacteriales bacterium]|tara:strand:- start:4645 stop:5526 length:882 start_codon:yes stop_codon:yes gene_type:complete
MHAYIFPGQGAQYAGMGKELYNCSELAKEMFEKANNILGFSITDIMFGEDSNALKQTKVTQPAIFIHSVILAKLLANNFKPDMVAGHSLGEFSALAAANYISFDDGLKLVAKRASAMQKACEKNPSTMAAVLGLEDSIVEKICLEIKEIVVPANYNCPGQLVISGTNKGIEIACEKLILAGAKRAIKIPVGGAFHSPLMESARAELEEAIYVTKFTEGICPIYQNVTAKAITSPKVIKENLNKQLTASVLWTQNMRQMILDGVNNVTEVGPGKVLQGLFKKIDRGINTQSAEL